jgi:hypothetical protein
MNDTRNRILDVALEVLGDNPDAGMGDIAAAAGVVRRTTPAAAAMYPIPTSGFSPNTSSATSRIRSRVAFMARVRADSVCTTPSLHNRVQ